MDLSSYSIDQIKQGLENAAQRNGGEDDDVRLLFAPTHITDKNFEQACDIYSRINPENFETVIVVESYSNGLEKKLPMASNKYFETPLGKVQANDQLRNEFCDEDDDFFISDEGYSKSMSLFDQLMMLQGKMDEDFSVVSVQLSDKGPEGPAIVKELAYVLEDVLAARNALIVFCCELPSDFKQEYKSLKELMENPNSSNLLNFLNSGESHIDGTGSFIAGIIVSREWDLKMNFLNGEYANRPETNLLTGYGTVQTRQRVV